MPLYQYFCDPCGLFIDELFKASERPNGIPCTGCGKTAEYRIGAPGMTRIQFEQNGRVGYKMKLNNGAEIRRSATRERYEHIGGNKSVKELKSMGKDLNRSVYSKSYVKHLNDKLSKMPPKGAK